MSDSLSKQNSLLSPKDSLKKSSGSFLSSIVLDSDISKKASPIKILEFIKIIGVHRNSANEIKELKNGYFASYGTDKKLSIYDRSFNLKIQKDDLGDWIYHILEISSQEKREKKDNDIQIIICTKKKLFYHQISFERNTLRNIKAENGGVMCLEIKKNNYITCGDDGLYILTDLFSKIIESSMNKLLHECYRGGYVINQNLVALSSNIIIPGGKDQLIFYNPNSKKVVKEFKDYSFIVSSNGLSYLESSENENDNIFLAACKKYNNNQKNGIFGVRTYFIENDDVPFFFEDTDNFEVNCFCPLSIIKNDQNITKDILGKNFTDNDNIEIIKTNYFFVGGFDPDSRRGLIKLYKTDFGDKDNMSIEYIQDIVIDKVNGENYMKETNVIELEKKDSMGNKDEISERKNKILKERNTFNGFGGAITSIIQSSITGNILVTCYDGNVYLFTPPNLDYYLSNISNNK